MGVRDDALLWEVFCFYTRLKGEKCRTESKNRGIIWENIVNHGVPLLNIVENSYFMVDLRAEL